MKNDRFSKVMTILCFTLLVFFLAFIFAKSATPQTESIPLENPSGYTYLTFQAGSEGFVVVTQKKQPSGLTDYWIMDIHSSGERKYYSIHEDQGAGGNQ